MSEGASIDQDGRSAEQDASASSRSTSTRTRQQATSLDEARSITQDRARDLRSLLKRYVRRHLPSSSSEHRTPSPAPPRRTGAYARLLPALRLVPIVLTGLFILSFWWDFPGVTLWLGSYPLALDGLLRIVSVSGLIGFLTNWLAITMLFHPREKRPLLGQGLIPAQRERVIYRLAQTISDELINAEMIKQRIQESEAIPRYRKQALQLTRSVLEDPDFRRDLKALTNDYVEHVLASPEVRQRIVDFTVEKMEKHASQSVAGLALKAYRFFNEEDFQRRIDEAIRELPDSLDVALDEMDHLLNRMPARIEAHSEDLEKVATRLVLSFVEKLDVYGIILSNMERYDDQQLEQLFKRTSNEQLNYIKYLGGVLGFFGGLVIWRPLPALVLFAVVGGGVWTLDVWLRRRAHAGNAP